MNAFLRTISVLLFISFFELFAQENNQSSPKFPLGAFLSIDNASQNVLESFDTSGLKIVACRADNNTSSFLDSFKVFANNAGWTDWIQYYATCYYSRWEAEQDTNIDHIGVKHENGQRTSWQGIPCWSSSGLTAPACSLMYGPHYRQDQRHKSYYHTGGLWGVNYIPRFNLALSNPDSLDQDRNICVIKVVYRYAKVYTSGDWELEDTVFLSDTLKVSDFPANGDFQIFNIVQNGINYYSYPEKFRSTITSDRITMSAAFPDTISPSDTLLRYEDRNSDNGIQFCVDYLGNDSTTLFIDYVEVFDQDGWDEYIDPQTHGDVLTNLQTYVQNYSDWDNIIYWYGQDEPYSQDSFTPIHIVDSLVQDMGGAPVTQYFQPDWRILVNGDSFMVDYYKKAKPPELIIDPYPFGPTWYPVRWEDLESLRQEFEIAHSLKPGFWFIGQGFGETLDGQWHIWRLPDSTELKASVMLALSHGLKGLLFWNYNSYQSSNGVYVVGIVGEDGSPSDLWYLIHDNFAPRLEGRLGDRLLGLRYIGDFIQARYFIPTDDPSNQTYDYLTLPYNQTATTMNWHAGFFNRNGYSDDKYFFLVNLLPNTPKSVLVKVTPPVPGFYNYRFRNYEGQFDTTFYTGSYLTYSLSHPAGEGYLYEVAPVVKYGGNLDTSETISQNMSLRDDMIIRSGVTLTVDATYDCYANIYLKGSGKIKTVNGGTINFYGGKGIIAQGSPTIQGTSSHKLTIDFNSSPNAGIQLLQGANTQMSYCILKNAENLIFSESSQFYTNLSYCDFQNTTGYAVSLAGTSSHTPYITHCTFTNTDYGIFGAGQSSFTISYNTFSDNKLAINLSQVSNPQIIANSISSNQNSDPGIQLSSCGGNIRANTVSGHSIGVSLANSSPQIGDNQVEDNYVNGIYIGAGSVPDLRGAIVGRPPVFYPISGYNLIQNNGGYRLPYKNDDGSEIYFGNSNILLNYGCNYIADNRTVSPPLLTTLYLMNGSTTTEVIQATDNAWGDTVYSSRFGNLSVNFTPYNDTICPLPQSGDMLIMSDNDGNTLDTLYSAGSPAYTPTATDLQYSEAEADMISKDYASADVIYNSIISNSPGSVNSQNAYLNLYKSKRLQNADSASMATLREMFTSNLGSITDSVMEKVVSQLSLLTLVNQRQYPQAINGFADIILQNPETEEAIFAEIDAMTTSLLAGNSNDTTLGKGLAKGLLVKGFKDYQDRMNQLIHKKFGVDTDTKEEQIIPTKYSLYNNYPNPFNPTTTIRFDIPERTNVELVVYDILGRKVKSLISNEVRNPGRYEVSFNANSLASGVYIYKITTKNYSQARKMLLIK